MIKVGLDRKRKTVPNRMERTISGHVEQFMR